MAGKENKLNKYGGAEGIAGAAVDLTSMVGDIVSAYQEDWELPEYKSLIDQINAQTFNGSNADLIAQEASMPQYTNITAKDLGNNGWSDIGKNALSYGMKGLSAGSKTGNPYVMAATTALGVSAGTWKGFVDKQKANDAARNLMKSQYEAFDKANSRRSQAAFAADSMNDSFMKKQVYAEGGELEGFNVGGTHEQNPLGGIPQGVGMDGIPNLVEEGETKYNNYIYSNRIKLTKKMCDQFLLPEKYIGKTMAEVSKKLAKDSGYDKAPNDNISKNGFNEMVDRLKNAQEQYKLEQMQRKLNRRLEGMSEEDKLAFLQSLEGGNKFSIGGYLDNPLITKGNHNSVYMNLLLPEESNIVEEPSQAPKIAVTNDGKSKAVKEDPMHPLAYSPLFANAANVLTDAFGLTNKVDPSDILALSKNLHKPNLISYRPTGRYQKFNPIDQQPLMNRLETQQNTQAARIADLSGGNRATALANMAASSKGYTESMGDLALKIADANNKERNATIAANNQLDLTNEQGRLNASQINATALNEYYKQMLELAIKQQQLLNTERMMAGEAINTNQNNFITDIASLGKYLSDIKRGNSNGASRYDISNNLKDD